MINLSNKAREFFTSIYQLQNSNNKWKYIKVGEFKSAEFSIKDKNIIFKKNLGKLKIEAVNQLYEHKNINQEACKLITLNIYEKNNLLGNINFECHCIDGTFNTFEYKKSKYYFIIDIPIIKIKDIYKYDRYDNYKDIIDKLIMYYKIHEDNILKVL